MGGKESLNSFFCQNYLLRLFKHQLSMVNRTCCISSGFEYTGFKLQSTQPPMGEPLNLVPP
eukprot:UN16264